MPVEQLVYTDRARGKGVDPNAAGYQIAACSPGLSAEVRSTLGNICMHYGDAVYRHAPRTAVDRETAWRTTTDTIAAVPPEVLEAFPIVWTYDRVQDDLVSLTRVRYSGFTHDGRTGNFLAHALVFDPRDLVRHGFTPLSLSQSEVFLDSYQGEETSLPAVPDLTAVAEGSEGSGLLALAPYHERLSALVYALGQADPSTRPVVLCVDDWRKALPIVDALLGLLPPGVRARTTFCTYESDHQWLSSTRAGPRPSHRLAAHHLLVLCRQDSRTFDLRPDEYRSGLKIFNFVGEQFSDVGTPGPYATFVASCVSSGSVDKLNDLHDLTEALGVGHLPASWDILVPAAGLRGALPREELVSAARALSTAATDPGQAKRALDELWPHIQRRSTPPHEADEVASLGVEVATLIDRTDPVLRQPFTTELVNLATAAFVDGRIRVATALLRACGAARDRGVLTLLNHAVRANLARPINVEEQQQALELLLDGLRLAEKRAEAAPPLAALLPPTFRAAREAGRSAEIWKRIGDAVVKPLLVGDWSDAKAQLLGDLIQSVPADSCPDGSFWLNLRLLDGARPTGPALSARLEELARACGACSDADKLTQDLLRLVDEHVAEPERRGDVLGRMAEASFDHPSGQQIFAAYLQVKAQDEELGRKLRRTLAKAGVSRVLCREILGELLPWTDESDSGRRFDSWWDSVLGHHPKVMNALCGAAAGCLERSGDTQGCLELSRAILSKVKDESRTDPDCVALANAVAQVLPFAPLTAAWQQAFRQTMAGLDAEADTRLKVLTFMSEVEQLTEDAAWTVAGFKHDDPRWHRAAALRPDDRLAAVRWCVTAFDRIGVTTPQEAEAFGRVLEAAGAGSAEEIGAAAARLLDGRDPVTCVVVLMAFARCTLEAPRLSKGGDVRVVGALLRRCEKSVRHLFEAHLDHRFARRTSEYDRRLDELRDEAGLARPKRTWAPADQPAGRSATGQEGSDTFADTVVDRAKSLLGKFLGRTNDASTDGTTDKKLRDRPDRRK